MPGDFFLKKLSLAQRFINSYNQIDYALRVQHNFKRSMGFSDMIRKSVPINNITRKYEDDLIDFGRLRNAIIHGTYYKDIDANLYIYDGSRSNKTEEKLEFINKFTLEELELMAMMCFITKHSKTQR